MSIIKRMGRGLARLVVLIVFLIAIFLMRATMTQGAEPSGGTYFLAAVALSVAFVGFKYFAQSRMADGPDWVRRTNLISAMLVLVGLLALILKHPVVGQIILYPSLLALGISFFRIDLTLKDMREEAAASMWRRLAYGGTGFVAIYVLAFFSKDSVLSLHVLQLAFLVMAVIIGFMTVAPRIASHREYFLALAGKEPKPMTQLPGEMLFDHGLAGHQMTRSWLSMIFYVYFLLVILISGIIAIPYCVYLLIRGGHPDNQSEAQ